MRTIKTILVLLVVGSVALFLFLKVQLDKQDKQREAEYAAERVWKDPLVRNCKDAVRRSADAATLSFGGIFGEDVENIDKTENGYIYYVKAADASTGNAPITILCYTDRNGQVVRLVKR